MVLFISILIYIELFIYLSTPNLLMNSISLNYWYGSLQYVIDAFYNVNDCTVNLTDILSMPVDGTCKFYFDSKMCNNKVA